MPARLRRAKGRVPEPETSMQENPGTDAPSSMGGLLDVVQVGSFWKDVQRARRLVSDAGVFYAAYRLRLKGWNVLLTIRNARGPDAIVYCDRGCCHHTLQIKSSRDNSTIRFGNLHPTGIMADFVVVVTLAMADPRHAPIEKEGENEVIYGPLIYLGRPGDFKAKESRSEGGKSQFFVNMRLKHHTALLDNWTLLGDPLHMGVG